MIATVQLRNDVDSGIGLHSRVTKQNEEMKRKEAAPAMFGGKVPSCSF